MRGSLITLDTDWAPDSAIDEAAAILLSHRVKATWFITHASPAIDRLREHSDLFELGIHPNFLTGSSHGTTPEEVLAYCMKLVPEARAMRTHVLVQSTPIFVTTTQKTPIESDYSTLLVHARDVQPTACPYGSREILRVPMIWEDDIEMAVPKPNWKPSRIGGDGLCVYDFHPIHVLLNSREFGPYENLKRSVKGLGTATREAISPFVNAGEGARTALEHMAMHLASSGLHFCARDVLADWKTARPT